jgi:hypothetical protein
VQALYHAIVRCQAFASAPECAAVPDWLDATIKLCNEAKHVGTSRLVDFDATRAGESGAAALECIRIKGVGFDAPLFDYLNVSLRMTRLIVRSCFEVPAVPSDQLAWLGLALSQAP